MASLPTPKPLRFQQYTVSWPTANEDTNAPPIYQLLVHCTAPNGERNTISLKCAYLRFHPSYGKYVSSHYGPQHPLYQEIWDYVNMYIETQIHYQYTKGQYGWITSDNPLELSFVKIIQRSEYETEFFFAHEALQKYQIKHYDIASTEPEELSDEQVNGKSVGWIEESLFTPIDGINVDEQDERDVRLNWKICREAYLLRKIDEVRLELNGRIANRGILFRQTVEQWLEPKIKALRGKITHNNLGKKIEIPFFTPANIWSYYLSPKFRGILAISDEDEFEAERNVVTVQFSALDLHEIIAVDKLIKIYDQDGKPFKYAAFGFDVENCTGIEMIHDILRVHRDKAASERYKKLRRDPNKKHVVLRRVSFMLCINGVAWRYNINSGKSGFVCNVYRVTYLSNGRKIVSGRVA